MIKIGNYWVPDGDAVEGYNLERTRAAYENGDGIQIDHLRGALEFVDEFELAIDGGANVGSWTKAMAGVFDRTHSFEPFAPAFACLERNVAEWELGAGVQLHEVALSDRVEGVSLSPAGEGRRSVTCGVTGKGSVPAISLDSLRLEACSLIKLDIEGYEAKALKGARKTIQLFQPWILIENRRPQEKLDQPSKAEKLLKRFGYELVAKFGDPELDWLYRKAL